MNSFFLENDFKRSPILDLSFSFDETMIICCTEKILAVYSFDKLLEKIGVDIYEDYYY